MKRFKNILFFADRHDGLSSTLSRVVALSKPHFPTDKRNHGQDATTIGVAMIPHDTLPP